MEHVLLLLLPLPQLLVQQLGAPNMLLLPLLLCMLLLQLLCLQMLLLRVLKISSQLMLLLHLPRLLWWWLLWRC